jgi:hypothetical protein
MKKNITIFFMIGLLSCFVAAFILWRVYSKYIGDPYNEFTRDADLAVPLLIQMDEDTLSQFAAPMQAHEKERSYSNNVKKPPYPIYGNMLVITYKYNGSREDIILYYKRLLTQYGWSKRGTDPETSNLYYINETACFDLWVRSDEYIIKVWHNLWNQEFGPKSVPDFPGTNLPIWNVLTLGEATVYTCP